jgi:putative nucleotidyltransferase with HDIG domain
MYPADSPRVRSPDGHAQGQRDEARLGPQAGRRQRQHVRPAAAALNPDAAPSATSVATRAAAAPTTAAARLNSGLRMPKIRIGMQPAPRHPPAAEARLREAIAHIGQLPVLDRALRRVRELAADPESDTNELVTALEADPGLAANILRFANSAACARPIRAQTVRQAVNLVGRVNVGRLAVEAAVCRFFELARGTGGVSRGLLHVHASQVAAVAGALAEHAGADADAAHLAGLLHDLGKLVMPVAFGEDELDAVARQHPIGAARAALERERFGVDHALAGEIFAREAFLEARVFNAIGAHHGDDIPSAEAACVQAADCAVHLLLDLHADAHVLSAALSALHVNASVLDDVVPVALPAVAPTVGGVAGRVAALERAASNDEVLAQRGVALEVMVGTAPAGGGDDVQAVLDAAAAALQQTRPPYVRTPRAA